MKTLTKALPILAVALSFNFASAAEYYSSPTLSYSITRTYQVDDGENVYQVNGDPADLYPGAVSEDADAVDVWRVNNSMKLAKSCKYFANEEEYGAWGNAVVTALRSHNFPRLMEGSSDLHQICKGYKNFGREDKESVWVLILSSMANFESTCNEKPRMAQGPNGSLVGLLQLHRAKENYYSKGCSKYDGDTAVSTIPCALAMLDNQLRRDGTLFNTKTYWDVLRTNSRTRKKAPTTQGGKVRYASPAQLIKEAVMQYPGCR